ncbi:MAG TPA: hypothetical protein ENJ82_14855, partial [Bacteroidetes bacterium]|nr:hypothetical protein [Bacteroidota bacterium]
CWGSIGSRKWSEKDMVKYREEEKPVNIYSPWIGNKYEKLKILAVGINMNQYGGTDAQDLLVNGAKSQLSKGRRKIDFGSKNYSGTFYFHRVPAYATIFLEKHGIIEEKRINNFPIGKDVANAFNYIALTNSVKCSPRGENGKPGSEMWRNCLSYILKEEVIALAPKIVLIFGISQNYNYFKEHVLDKVISDKGMGNRIRYGKGIVNGVELGFFGIPHPTSRGGNAVKIFNYLNKIIKERDCC